jgi:rhodanese-related sulfurtransferase
MKKALYFIVPVILIFVASRIYKGNTEEKSNSAYCNLSAKEYIEVDTKDAVILDVRTQREFDYGHLENAIVVDIYQKSFREEINKLDKEKTYYVYCKTGTRSRSAVNYMLQSGFKKVCNLDGGINYLSSAGVKLVQ